MVVEQERPEKPDRAEGDEHPATASGKMQHLLALRRYVTVKTVSLALGLSLLLHLGYLFGGGRQFDLPEKKQEVTLGEFHYEPDADEETPVMRADFRLHISLLSEVDRITRERLASHEYRVQQNVEQLLRQAYAGDFLDPTLTELKRQLQEKINDTLSVRGISEVIITDLRLQRRTLPGVPEVLPERGETALGTAIPAADLRIPPAPSG